ncbi:Protein CBG16820 [Caenorhabditis briggsae]|uniref:Protein CBG16820 n=1 Tax=Caenorhabditis briggsae TaxID=6238 RepID=A8XPV8_CAEBR|nr:Protein CBG16820 [Caenorhabditis briggsae]CAP34684.2 Protein CBG16820 [Caenorhabditis briggsae]
MHLLLKSGWILHRTQAFHTSVNRFLSVLPQILNARQFPQRRSRPKREEPTSSSEKNVYKNPWIEISWSSKGHRETKEDAKQASEGNENGGGGGKDDDPRKKLMEKMKRWLAISLFAYGVLFMLSPKTSGGVTADKISWSEFINELLPTGQIYRIIVLPEQDIAYLYVYDTGAKNSRGERLANMYRVGIPSVGRFETEVRAAEAALGLPPEHWTQIEYKRSENITQWMTIIFLGGLLIGGFLLFRKFKGSFNMTDMMSNMTKGKFTIIDPHSAEGKKQLKIKFKDVAGCSEAKVEVREFVDYLKNPGRFTKLGAKLPRGALLTGPPGCGKTLLAKALAAESTVPFISMNGSEFVEVIGGLGASRIRGLFKEARTRAPCIIYIDEIDAIGRKRSEGKGAGGFGGGSGEEEQTLNQLLVEMDGMGSGNGVVVLASTNRADVLDKALLRPGRFDRHISIDLPTMLERKDMFELYMRKIKLDHAPQEYSQRLAAMTPGFSGADIMNVCNESAIRAASNKKHVVTIKDVEYALDRVLAGSEKRSRSLVEEEREVVAYHEAGHALVGWMLEHTDALLKVTIIPRTSAALGFAQYSPRDKKLFAKEELFDRMCMMLGGRCAENLKFGRITSGAQDDLQKVTKSAYAQVKLYGMSENVGPLSFPNTEGFQIKPYSKKFAAVFDQEASLMVAKASETTTKLIKDNMDKLETVGTKIAQALLKREVLNYEDVKQLIGKPKFGDKHLVDMVEMCCPKTMFN